MKIQSTLLALVACLLLLSGNIRAIATPASGRVYTLPSRLEGVRQSIFSLNGSWDFKYSPRSRWTTIQVPGEAAMQGFAIEHDKPFFYKKTFMIPDDFKGKRVI